MSDKDLIAIRYWGLPERVRNAVSDLLIFYGECTLWFEDGGFHMTWLGCTFGPYRSPDYESFGKITHEMMPDLWAFRFGRGA